MTIMEQLKKNVIVCGEMPDDLQTCMFAMKIADFDRRNYNDWIKCSSTEEFEGCYTYRLRADYEDEPEIVEYPIFEFNGRLKYKQNLADGDDFGIDIDMAARNPDFIGFRFGDGKMYPISTVYKFKNKLITYYSIDIDRLDEYEVLHATAVLFRRPKC